MDARERAAVLFDPHPLWLDAVHEVLEPIGIRVAAKVTALPEALEAVERERPDVLITELDGSGGDPAAPIRAARAANPQLRVIVLSVNDDPRCIAAALDAGAVAYVIKTAQREDLVTTIRQAFEHSVFFAPATDALPRSDDAAPPDASGGLTKREVEILRLVGDGRSNAQVAGTLWVTEQTVKFHLSNIYKKLHVANRTEASRWAQTRGLLGHAAAESTS